MTEKNYYTPSDSFEFEYYKVPKVIFKSKRLKKISAGARLLYVLILNRLTVSIKNGMCDDDGRVYLYYSLEEVCETLCCSMSKAVRLFKEIDNKTGIGLIERIRTGLGKDSVIYVFKNGLEDAENDEEEQVGENESTDIINKKESEAIFLTLIQMLKLRKF